MKLPRPLLIAAIACTAATATAQQTVISRIESMPAIPSPYEMRDWKQVARDYVSLVFDGSLSGDHLPLSSQEGAGNNYPAYSPIRMDTYVGWGAHGSGSEAINVMPAVATAYLVGAEGLTDYRLAEGVMDFFNKKNGQNVYLNGFSARSGNDWWYDLMPNVYFYQLCQLAPMPVEADGQYLSIAEQWLKAVWALGGKTYDWTRPNMGHRAFNLATMQPLSSGVKEPESAGTIAWLLMHAWLKTGDARYRKGAELAMEYLSSLGSNPAYELQLAYGVQAAAKMNAILGTAYRVEKLFDNCFTRGYLRGWGSIVGKWGGYDVSGLIGEANDGGNDYAFVMNGFQQVAALAPAVKYDKRLARAYARWTLNVANASRLFYASYLPSGNMESASHRWSVANDARHAIPFESMKEAWNGTSPFAMGDAVGGKWAETNLSLYSGSSVGYLAAVVERTDVEAILRLDLNATDRDGLAKMPTYLYYNPHTASKTVTVALPEGAYKIYDMIAEQWIADNATQTYRLTLPADGVAMVVLVPQATATRTEGGRLLAGDCVIDYHVGYDFSQRLRIKNLEAAEQFPVKGETVEVKAIVEGASETATYAWTVDGQAVAGTSALLTLNTSALSATEHTMTCRVSDKGATCSETATFTLLATPLTVPRITAFANDAATPAVPGAKVIVTCDIADRQQATEMAWTVSGGEITSRSDYRIEWTLPRQEGVYAVTCKASNIKGEDVKTANVLVRATSGAALQPYLHFPFDGSVTDCVSGVTLGSASGGAPTFGAGARGEALQLDTYYQLAQSQAESPAEAITIAFWVKPLSSPSREQFVVSHGSWQDRYKLSLTPDMKMRWTARTTEQTVDVDHPTPLAVGQWEHFCAVYTGFSLEIYRNGALSAYAPLAGTLGTTTTALTIGTMLPGNSEYPYDGMIDDLQFYAQAITPSQAMEIYRDGKVGVKGITAVHDAPAHIYTLDGRRVTSATKMRGPHIVRRADQSFKLVNE